MARCPRRSSSHYGGEYRSPPTTDQRGISRPQGSACDSGSYELVTTISVTIDISPGETIDAELSLAPGEYRFDVQTFNKFVVVVRAR